MLSVEQSVAGKDQSVKSAFLPAWREKGARLSDNYQSFCASVPVSSFGIYGLHSFFMFFTKSP
jgi:hypothetical protein